MSVLRIFLVLPLVSFYYARSQERIVGGKEVRIDDFPYHLSVRLFGFYLCGGALIGAKHGLSAAHCFRFSGIFSVKAGSDLKDSGGTVVYVKTVFLHPERYSHPFQYDIAILEFQEPLEFGSSIQPVNLPDNEDSLSPGIKGMISGFGETLTFKDRTSKVLRAAEVIVQESERCRSNYWMYRIILTSTVFCAGLSQGGRDSCQGDSGGPFVVNNVLYGLVSFGIGCGDSEHPGVYTNVASYREFIRLNTGI